MITLIKRQHGRIEWEISTWESRGGYVYHVRRDVPRFTDHDDTMAFIQCALEEMPEQLLAKMTDKKELDA